MKTYEYSCYHPNRNVNKKKNYFFSRYGQSIKRVDLTSFYSPTINYKHFVVKCPNSWNFLLLNTTKSYLDSFNFFKKKKKVLGLFDYKTTRFLYLYSNIYFFYIPIPPTDCLINIDPNTSSVVVTTMYTSNYYRLYLFYLKNVFFIFHKPFFNRVKFKGKGYYIYKNKRNTITPQFGHSHRIYMYSYFTSVTFLSKTKILIFGVSKLDILTASRGIKSMRRINIFTGRGVRFNRQIVFKKTGKVSSYR